MPKVKANGINMNYEKQGAGEALVLIPFTSADNACYAFQVPEYSKHFGCISVDLRGAGGVINRRVLTQQNSLQTMWLD